MRLGDLSREVHIQVYSHFDVLTQVRILVGFLRMSKALTGGANRISGKETKCHRRAYQTALACGERIVVILEEGYLKGAHRFSRSSGVWTVPAYLRVPVARWPHGGPGIPEDVIKSDTGPVRASTWGNGTSYGFWFN